jgi:Ca-activated chloride channel family protein
MEFSFNNPYMLLFLIIIPIIYAYYFIISRKKKKEAIKFSHLAIIKKAMGNKKRLLRTEILFYLTVFSLLFLFLGLADPHIPLEQTKEGVNVVLIIDDSGSMKANDYSPTRLEAAKKSAEILINSLKPKDHIGIVIFESGATTAAYMTPFKEKAVDKLRAIAQKEGKTAIGDGLSLAIDMAIPFRLHILVFYLISQIESPHQD